MAPIRRSLLGRRHAPG